MVAGYRLEDRIGRGGMAVVFRAHDVGLDRRVALKVLPPALAADESFRQRFLRESRAAATVDHPHIIPVFEAGQDGGVLFIAMRYVSGGDVLSLLRSAGPLPARRAAGIIAQVASALDAAHEAGLVHRDVKPSNMLLDEVRLGRPDHVYLSDFGLTEGTMSSAGRSGSVFFLGTPDYLSPEQIAGGPVDGRADQYALACAAFELLAGEPPFQRDQEQAVIDAHLNAPAPPVSSRRPGLPPGVDDVLARALAKAPSGRFGTCREFAEALRVALGPPSYHAGPAGGPRVPGVGEPPVSQPETVLGRADTLPASAAAARATVPQRREAVTRSAAGLKPEPGQLATDSTIPDEAGRSGPGATREWRLGRRVSVTVAAAAVLAAAAITIAILGPPSASVGRRPASAGLLARHVVAYVFGGDTVTPIDLATDHAGTPIPVGSGMPARAFTIAPDGNTAYVTYGDGDILADGWVRPFDLATGRAGARIGVGSDPDAIAVTPNGKAAYIANANSDTVTPINLVTGRAGAPIQVGGGPVAIAITPDGKTAYVVGYANANAATDGWVMPIDLATGRAGTPIQVGNQPQAIAIAPDGKTAYVVNDNGGNDGTVTPIDVATDRAGTPITVPNLFPGAIAIAPDGKTAYVSADGTAGGVMTPIDLATGRAGTPILGGGPGPIAIAPDGKTAYVIIGSTVTPVDLATGRTGTPIQFRTDPEAIAITP